jgi:predicted outer membrane repeat protein
MSNKNNAGVAAGGGAIYALGIFGAWVWFFHLAHNF